MQEGQLVNDRYRLTGRLGEGGMSVVWSAQDEVLGRPVAVKMLTHTLAADTGWHRRIRVEARAAARLSHPNVINVYDYGQTADGQPYVVMELLRGSTLAARIAGGPLAPAAAMRVAAEVAEGLAAVHAEGIVHRDVKPANVVLAPGAAKLVDFGIVGVAGDPDGPSPGSPDNQLLGTPAYLAPERLRGGDVTPASDMYAFGLLLYRCLTGRLPWDNETTTQMILAHVTVAPQPLPHLPGVPRAVRELCMRCLHKDPESRPSAAQAAAILGSAAGILPRFDAGGVPASPPAEPSTALIAARHSPAGGTERRHALIGTAVAVALAAALVAFVLGRPGEQPQASADAAAPPAATQSAQVATAGDQDPVSGPTGNPANDPAADPASDPAGGTAGAQAGGPGTKPGGGSQPTTAPPPRSQTGGGQGGGGAVPADTHIAATAGPTVRIPTLAGVIVAGCVGKKVQVTDVQPAPGAKVLSVQRGARETARVEFDVAGLRARFDVRCAGAVPVATPR